mmetsp:Transcript_36710/g.91977  ORF Transcript_36710/g.91977 Transcript_36710/m.91977 type:complete len:222 (-) Transcript_36710:1245-1910(-)
MHADPSNDRHTHTHRQGGKCASALTPTQTHHMRAEHTRRAHTHTHTHTCAAHSEASARYEGSRSSGCAPSSHPSHADKKHTHLTQHSIASRRTAQSRQGLFVPPPPYTCHPSIVSAGWLRRARTQQTQIQLKIDKEMNQPTNHPTTQLNKALSYLRHSFIHSDRQTDVRAYKPNQQNRGREALSSVLLSVDMINKQSSQAGRQPHSVTLTLIQSVSQSAVF